MFTFSDVSGSPISAAGFADQTMFFATEYELGRYLVWGGAIAALVSFMALASAAASVS